MNKLLLILAILITNFSIECQEQKKYQELQFKFTGDCLNVGSNTLIEAEVTNYEEKIFYLNSDNLLSRIKFYDQDGRMLFPTKKVAVIEECKKDKDKFVLIEPKTTKVIKLETHVFDMYDFKPNTEYTLVASYHNDENYKWKIKATYKGYIHANLFKFKVCE